MTPRPSDHDRRASSAHVLVDAADQIDSASISLGDDVEHHLRRVLRLRDGESVSVTDGRGRWRMSVARVGTSLELEATSAIVVEPEPDRFTLASAIPKGDRIDWLVQKATELGADRMQLIHAERSTVRWKPERAAKQVARLQRIADEALRQSRRVWRCTVLGPVDAAEILPDASCAEPGGDAITGEERIIAVGPEGGWSVEELGLAPRLVRVGDHVLRTETAAVAATTLRMAADH